MERRYRQKLPLSLCDLVDEIETAGHVEIQVRLDPQLETTASAGVLCGGCARGGGPDAMDLILRFKGRLAAVDRTYRQPFAAAAHELLHLRRWIVQGVPRLHAVAGLPDGFTTVSSDPVRRLFSTTGIEEQVEHCVIDRSLPSYGFEFPNAGSIRQCWDSIPAPPWPNWGMLRWLVLQEWIRVQFLTDDPDLRQYAEGVMQRLGMLADGQRLTDQFRWLLDSPDQAMAKYAMILELCRAFRIPPGAVGFFERRPGYLGVMNLPRRFEVPTRAGERTAFEWEPYDPEKIPSGLLDALVRSGVQAADLPAVLRAVGIGRGLKVEVNHDRH